MSEIVPNRGARRKTGGRQRGTVNRVTLDIREALRDLAEGNAHLVQSWLDRVAEGDPAEALRLWLALLRFVTPTLQAAAIADLTPSKSTRNQLAGLTDAELFEIILQSPKAATLAEQGVRTNQELLVRMVEPSAPDPPGIITAVDDELLR